VRRLTARVRHSRPANLVARRVGMAVVMTVMVMAGAAGMVAATATKPGHAAPPRSLEKKPLVCEHFSG